MRQNGALRASKRASERATDRVGWFQQRMSTERDKLEIIRMDVFTISRRRYYAFICIWDKIKLLPLSGWPGPARPGPARLVAADVSSTSERASERRRCRCFDHHRATPDHPACSPRAVLEILCTYVSLLNYMMMIMMIVCNAIYRSRGYSHYRRRYTDTTQGLLARAAAHTYRATGGFIC